MTPGQEFRITGIASLLEAEKQVDSIKVTLYYYNKNHDLQYSYDIVTQQRDLTWEIVVRCMPAGPRKITSTVSDCVIV
jgi:hypothetical protein